MTTKIPVELSSTPGISDSSNATAITIDSSERVGIGVTPSDHSGYVLQMSGGSQSFIAIGNDTTGTGALNGLIVGNDSSGADIYQRENQPLRFHTNNTERMRILAAGGLTFNGDTAAANALDDYEEGSWTPTIIGDSGASGQSYSIQYGTYTRIGNFVQLNFDVRLSALGTLSGTYVWIGGHGFTFKGNNLGGSALVGYVANVSNSNHYPLTAYINSTGVYLMQGGNGYITTAAAGGNFITNTTVLIGTITGILA